MTDLIFRHAGDPPRGDAVDLDFAADLVGAIPATQVIALAARMAAPRMAASANYDNRVSRGVRRQVVLPHSTATPVRHTPRCAWGTAAHVQPVWQMRHSLAVPLRISSTLRWQSLDHVRRQAVAVWARGVAARTSAVARWQVMQPRRVVAVAPHAAGMPRRCASVARWQVMWARRWAGALPWQSGAQMRPLWSLPAQAQGVRQRLTEHLPWQSGRSAPPGKSVLPPSPPLPTPWVNTTALTFCAPPHQSVDGGWPLIFMRDPCEGLAQGLTIPTRRVYFVSNTASLVALPSGTPINAYGMDIALESDSVAWTLTAQIDPTQLALVAPDSDGVKQVQAQVNDATWVFIIERTERSRAFGQASLRISGLSQTAELSRPYATLAAIAANGSPRTMSQASLGVLPLGSGFALDWNAADWTLPAGVLSAPPAAPLDHLVRLAKSAAARVVPSRAARALTVRALYPLAPWEWADAMADYTLAEAAILNESISLDPRPFANAVYIMGDSPIAGVSALIRRAGTAGDQLADMIVDTLAVTSTSALALGTAALASAGTKARVSLVLPVYEETGVIDPGQLVQVGSGGSAWRGLSRGIGLQAAWAETLTINQTVSLERAL